MLTDQDIYLFREGTHGRLCEHMGCHLGADGGHASFAVWAPNASKVSVIGDFNGWEDASASPCSRAPMDRAIWQASVAEASSRSQTYKYQITGADGRRLEKADPYAFYAEVAPATASRAWDLAYRME